MKNKIIFFESILNYLLVFQHDSFLSCYCQTSRKSNLFDRVVVRRHLMFGTNHLPLFECFVVIAVYLEQLDPI